ncbi:hypothetical protein SLS60_003878 [Paraconiothyrium brasiliense]|uniref:HNH endonuclease n=1 Tax=Paraconiothyrium brasiliense TaxID=300254 RepID=A0ABR3RPV7_9PLEO
MASFTAQLRSTELAHAGPSLSHASSSSSSYDKLLETSIDLWLWTGKVWEDIDEDDAQLILRYGPEKLQRLCGIIQTGGQETAIALHQALSHLDQVERHAMVAKVFEKRRREDTIAKSSNEHIVGSRNSSGTSSSTIHSSILTPVKRGYHDVTTPSTGQTDSSGGTFSTTVQSPQPPGSRRASKRPTYSGITSNKRPKLTPVNNVASTRTEIYCTFCNKTRKHTPLSHVFDHLVADACTSLRTELRQVHDNDDEKNLEGFLLGCGYCGGAGSSKKFFGEAFKGPTKLAQHVVEEHCSQRSDLTWDINNAINNVLSSKVFREDFDNLRHQNYMHTNTLFWQSGSDTEALLYNLEDLGGKRMGSSGEIEPLNDADRAQIAVALDSAHGPIQQSSFERIPGSSAVVFNNAVPELNTQACDNSFMPKQDRFVRGAEPPDPFQEDMGGLDRGAAQEADVDLLLAPSETYDFSLVDIRAANG